MQKIDELKQQASEALEQARSLNEEKKREEADEKMKEYRSLKQQIEIQAEFDAEEERELEDKTKQKEAVNMEQREQNQDVQYRGAFYKFVQGGNLNADEQRTLSAGSASGGGYTVPQSFRDKLVKKLEEMNIMRRLGTVITTDNDTDIPIVLDRGEAAWTDENGAYNESDETFGQITISAHKLTRIIKVSEELLQDTGIDLEAHLVLAFAQSLAKAEEAAFVNGDGVKKPTGVFVDAQVGVTASSGSAITADEIIDLYYSLPRAYREKATFVANDSTVKAVRKLKDSENNYIWEKGLGGEPDKILGRPVETTEYAPEVALNANVLAFGDFSYYHIGDRSSRVFTRLNEKYADQGQVGFRGMERVDGKLALPEAVKVLQMASA